MSRSLPSESAQAEDRILLVEDDRGHRELLHDELTDAGYRVVAVTDAAEALAAFRETTFAAVVSDLRLPGKDGFHVLESARAQVPVPGFVMLTGFGTIDQAVSALKAGADEFLTKPVDLEHLRLTLQRVLQSRRLQVEVQEYREILGEKGFHGMLGKCPAMLKLFDLVRRVAQSDGSVLITGESGTGKELVARALHRESPRKDGPFVAINCAGIPETLLESELFGHAAGSFTGARGARKGLFQEAHGGTLFLDEIGEMPVSMQTKLLRVLQDGKVRPVGANEEVDSDVRVLAATHRDLAEEMGEGRFRQDLFFRLETFRLHVPPVRERGEDIPALLEFFLRRYGLVRGYAPPRFEPAAMRRLLDYRFPGNVRELESLVERAATLAREDWIRVADLPERVRAQRDPVDPTGLQTSQQSDEDWQTLAEVEARYLRRVLDFTGGNKQRAARILGIGRRTLYRRLGENL
jgi:DNA-binding NtrC family response regulator